MGLTDMNNNRLHPYNPSYDHQLASPIAYLSGLESWGYRFWI